jgi:aminopeptidase N
VFDQPDMKAKMTLVVTCPNEWKVVANSIERRFEKASIEGKMILERHGIE